MSLSAGAAGAPALPPPSSKQPEQSQFKQHRCHARLADVAHTFIEFKGSEFGPRFKLLMQCYKSEPGQEPKDPYLVDPEKHKVKQRHYKEAAPPRG